MAWRGRPDRQARHGGAAEPCGHGVRFLLERVGDYRLLT